MGSLMLFGSISAKLRIYGAHLLGHLADNNPCVNHYQPSGFAFELVSPEHRFHRQQQLAQELRPMCKGRAFAYKMNS
jgi:hypothetical protein